MSGSFILARNHLKNAKGHLSRIPRPLIPRLQSAVSAHEGSSEWSLRSTLAVGIEGACWKGRRSRVLLELAEPNKVTKRVGEGWGSRTLDACGKRGAGSSPGFTPISTLFSFLHKGPLQCNVLFSCPLSMLVIALFFHKGWLHSRPARIQQLCTQRNTCKSVQFSRLHCWEYVAHGSFSHLRRYIQYIKKVVGWEGDPGFLGAVTKNRRSGRLWELSLYPMHSFTVSSRLSFLLWSLSTSPPRIKDCSLKSPTA